MKNLFKSLAFITLISFAGACKDNTQNVVETTTDQSQQQNEVVVEDTRFSVTIESNDQMQFDKSELKVPVGEPIVLTFKHVGKMAKNIMGHNFVLLDQEVDFRNFAEKAMLAAENDYIPADQQNSILAHTKMIGGGQSDTIEFTISEAGSYEFLCTFPGHYAIMRGILIAE